MDAVRYSPINFRIALSVLYDHPTTTFRHTPNRFYTSVSLPDEPRGTEVINNDGPFVRQVKCTT